MPEPIEPHAQPIPQTGAPEWAPPPEDDDRAAPDQARPQNLRAIFFGRDGLRAGWSFLLFVLLIAGIFAGAGAVFHAITHRSMSTPPEKIARVLSVVRSEYSTFAVLAVAALIVGLVERRRFGRFGIGSFTRLRASQFALGAALGLGVFALLIFSLKTAGLILFDGVLLHGAATVHYGLLWFVAFLGVGLTEEFATRGFVQFTLTRGIAGLARTTGMNYRRSVVLGFWLSALLFSVVFGLGHTSNPGESPFGIFSAGAIGLIFAFSLWRTGSLWWAIGYHAAWDWAESFLFGTADSGLLIQHHLLASHPAGKPLLSGGLTGPEGSIFDLAEMLISILVIYFFLKPEPGSYADPNWTPNDRVY